MSTTHPAPSDSEVPGARWWRVDFHTHTGHSNDAYKNTAYSDREWLLAHMAKGIDAICVTDHNGGRQIDKLKAAYAEMAGIPGFRPLTLFPGVELSTSDDVHLLAIFDPDQDSAKISALLGEVGLKGGQEGDATLQLRHGLKTILDNLSAGGFDCVLIPAHVNGPKGLIKAANARVKDEALAHPALYALECAWDKSVDWSEGLKAIERKQNKVFSTVYGSDSHEMDQIGRRTSWVRMESPTLDGLRIALMDGAGSVVECVKGQPQPGPSQNLWLRELSLDGTTYLDRQSPLVLRFNPGLNTIIGGRGSGKSTLIELIRKVTNRSGELGNLSESDLRDQHEGLVNDALAGQPHAKVFLVYESHGKQSRMAISGGPAQAPTLEVLDEKGVWNRSTLPVADWKERYPLRIYSQKHLYSYRKSTASLLDEIDYHGDGMAGLAQESQWEHLQNTLIQTMAKISELSAEVAKESGLVAKKDDLSRQIKLLEQVGHKEVLQNLSLRRKQQAEVKRWTDARSGLPQELRDLVERLKLNTLALSRLPGQQDEAAEKAAEQKAEAVHKAYHEAAQVLEQTLAKLTHAESVWEEDLRQSSWQSKVADAQAAYSSLTAKLSNEQAANPALYGNLVQQFNQVEEQLGRCDQHKKLLAEFKAKKESVIAELVSERLAISKTRTEFLAQLFDGREDLKITLKPFGDDRRSLETLRAVLQRTDDAFSEIDELVKRLHAQPPTVDRIRHLKDALKTAAVKGDRHEAFEGVILGKHLCGHLARRTSEDWARLEAWFPPDSLRIQISRGKGKKPDVDLSRASPGQVATAVLAFLLAYGDQPLILDQPEDDLDNEMIFSVIVEELRRNKRKRQLIIVTHNPNLVVNGNSDMIFPLDTSVGPTRLPEQGTLQIKEVRDAVCRIMEGGERALEQRFRRMIPSGGHKD